MYVFVKIAETKAKTQRLVKMSGKTSIRFLVQSTIATATMVSDIIAWSSSTQEQKFNRKSRRSRKKDRSSRSSINQHKRQSILKAQEEEQKQIADALSQNPEDLLKSFLEMQSKIKEMEMLQAAGSQSSSNANDNATSSSPDSSIAAGQSQKSQPFFDPNPPEAPLLKDWSIVDGELVYTPPAPPPMTIPTRATPSRAAAAQASSSQGFSIRPEDLKMALRPVNKNTLNTAETSASSEGTHSAIFNKTLSNKGSNPTAVAAAAGPTGAAQPQPMDFQQQLAQQLALRNQKQDGKEKVPFASPSTRPRPSQTVKTPPQQPLVQTLSVAGKRIEARSLPGEEYMSFSDRICVAAKMPLRNSGPKSPGGTPLNRRRSQPESVFSEALRKKFENVRLSDIPAVGDNDWD